jgi:hypothetical protein
MEPPRRPRSPCIGSSLGHSVLADRGAPAALAVDDDDHHHHHRKVGGTLEA